MDVAGLESKPLFPKILWLLFAASLLAAGGTCLWTVSVVAGSPRPQFLAVREAEAGAGTNALAPDELALAGSGSNLPLTRLLLDSFSAGHPEFKAVLHESIGSSGGIRAARDGAISLGLISRPLKGEERDWGLVVVPYARVAVVLAAHHGVPARVVNGAELLDLYRGRWPRWSDGQRVTVLQREPGDSSHAAVESVLHGFREVNVEAYRASRWRVLFSDQTMLRALQDTSGAVGLTDTGLIALEMPGLKILPLEGMTPSHSGLADGSYPYAKNLALVAPRHASPAAASFLEFVRSAEGRRIIAGAGYLPLGQENSGQETP